MRKIMVARYVCDVCETPYDKKSDAKRCEASPVEQKKFKMGDMVQVEPYLICPCGFGLCKVVKVSRVLPPMESKTDRLSYGGVSEGVHVYKYNVVHTCGIQRKEDEFYTPVLKLLKKDELKKVLLSIQEFQTRVSSIVSRIFAKKTKTSRRKKRSTPAS